MARRTWHTGLIAAILLSVGLACSTPAATDEEGTTIAADPAIQVIDHLSPRPDSVGPAPSEFSWTPVAGATRYAVGVWDDVDRLVWRHDAVPEAWIASPDEPVLDPGTYFWSITALRGDAPVGESGRAAFVVRDP